jgi:hypothetical protein
MTDIFDLFGVESAEAPRELALPDFAFRLRVQLEVEEAILEMHARAHSSSKPKVPPPVELVDGRVDGTAVTERWHVIRELGRKVSDERVTELLDAGARRILEHEAEIRRQLEG